MDLYGIVRRSGWASTAELEAAAARALEESDRPDSGARWIRSYVIVERNGTYGSFCVYEADGRDAIRAHAEAAGLPLDEIVSLGDTVVMRPDPLRAAA